MKAFEEWLAKKELGIYIQNHDDRCEVERHYKDGWRAALEKVLDQCHHHQSQDVIDWILKELEDK